MKKRLFYIDKLRAIACLAVVMIHVSSLYMVNMGNKFDFFIANFFDGVSRIGVPIFVMISGALLLDQNCKNDFSDMVTRIKRLFVKFIVWSVIYSMIYNIFFCIIRKEPISGYKIIYYVIVGHYHLWFIYMLLGLYLIVPLLKLWIKKENEKEIKYFIILAFIFTFFLPQVIDIVTSLGGTFEIGKAIENAFDLKYVGGYTVYFILGWYLNNYELKKSSVYILGAMSFIFTIFGNYFLANVTHNNSLMFDNLSVNILLQSIFVFCMVKNSSDRDKLHKKTCINRLSDKSLGIYLVHVVVVEMLYTLVLHLKIGSSFLGCIFIFLGTVCISSLIIGVIKKTKISKYII